MFPNQSKKIILKYSEGVHWTLYDSNSCIIMPIISIIYKKEYEF